jgi:hypothetical protein
MVEKEGQFLAPVAFSKGMQWAVAGGSGLTGGAEAGGPGRR